MIGDSFTVSECFSMFIMAERMAAGRNRIGSGAKCLQPMYNEEEGGGRGGGEGKEEKNK